MKKNCLASVIIVLVLLSIYSCSLVKNPLASKNFNRVKYNSHLKYSKSKVEKQEVAVTEMQVEKTVRSFTKENSAQEKESVIANNIIQEELRTILQEGRYSDAPAMVQQSNNFLQKIAELKIEESHTQNSTALHKRDNWWEDEIEDWPWLEIVLALIAVLIVLMIVSLLFSVIGGLVSSLLGLILLLILAYILYTMWF